MTQNVFAFISSLSTRHLVIGSLAIIAYLFLARYILTKPRPHEESDVMQLRSGTRGPVLDPDAGKPKMYTGVQVVSKRIRFRRTYYDWYLDQYPLTKKGEVSYGVCHITRSTEKEIAAKAREVYVPPPPMEERYEDEVFIGVDLELEGQWVPVQCFRLDLDRYLELINLPVLPASSFHLRALWAEVSVDGKTLRVADDLGPLVEMSYGALFNIWDLAD